MIRAIIFFVLAILIIAAALAYFALGFSPNFDYFNKEKPAKVLMIEDKGKRGESFYDLKIYSDGEVEYTDSPSTKRVPVKYILTSADVNEAVQKAKGLGLFNFYRVNRAYCLGGYEAEITINLGAVFKKIDHHNCDGDDDKIIEFRNYLYSEFTQII